MTSPPRDRPGSPAERRGAGLRVPARVQGAVAVAAASAGLLAAGATAAVTVGDILRPGGLTAETPTRFVEVVWLAGLSLVGLLLAFRRPENRVSWLIVGLAPLLGYVLFAFAYRITPPAGAEYAVEWLTVMATWLAIGFAGPVLALIFPTGELPSRRWRGPVGATLATFLVSLVLLASTPGKLGDLGAQGRVLQSDPRTGIAALEPLAGLLSLGLFGALLVLAGAGIAAVVQRRRSGDAVVRAQLSWFLLAVSLIPIGFLVSVVESGFVGEAGVVLGPAVLYTGFALTPIAVGIAVLRYRLFDIEVVVRRTVTYGAVVALLALLYGVTIVVLQAAVVTATGGEGVAVALATLLVAAAFQPVRRRVREAIDRRFYRSRADRRALLQRLSVRLRNELELEAVAADVVRFTSEALRPARVNVWLRPQDRA